MHVEHDRENRRFSVRLSEGNGDLHYRMLLSGVIDFHRTEVDPGLRGKGVAGELAVAAIGYAREEGLEIKATCTYVAGWLRKHPVDPALAGA
jgi:predicted GNAT family acetyltransferase